MTETVSLTKVSAGIEDVLSTASSTPVAQTRRSTAGTLVSYNITPFNSSSLKASTATQALHASLAATVTLNDVFAILITGGAFQYASTSQNGQVYRMSAAPAVADQPTAIEQNDARVGYIPTSTQKSALAVVTTQSVSLTHTPSATVGYATTTQVRDDHSAMWGTGKDGAFKTGTIVDPAAAPSALTTATSGGLLPADTYTYKVTYGNATGETLPSAASATITTTGAASTVTMTIPVGGANAAWRKIYRDEGSSSWKLVAYIPDNVTTSWTDTQLYVSSTAAPGSNTADTSWDAPAGEYHFDGDMTIPAVTLGGDITIRCRGIVTISGAVVGTGLGSGKSRLTPIMPTQVDALTATIPTQTLGFSTQWQSAAYPGAGSAGMAQATSAVGGAGSLPGATIRIYAHAIRFAADITSSGATATAGSGGVSAGGGGGGAGGIVWTVARDAITSGTHTITLNGGTGGAGFGSGGAATAFGGGGGGGGLFFASAPILDLANLTVTKNAGSAGANDTDATTRTAGGNGGSCAGDGGAFQVMGSAGVPYANVTNVATAGQSVTTTQFAMGGLR